MQPTVTAGSIPKRCRRVTAPHWPVAPSRLTGWLFSLACIFSLAALPAFAQTSTLSIGSGSGTPGNTVTVSISLNNTVPVQGLQFDIKDSRNIVDVEDISGTSRLITNTDPDNIQSLLVVPNLALNDSTSTVIIFGIGAPPLPVGSGSIVTVTFRLKGGLFNGTYPVTLDSVVVSDSNGNGIPLTLTPGTITVTGGREPDTTPPAAPTGLNATPGDGKATLNWNTNAASDLWYYTVYRSLVNGFTVTSGDSITRVVKPTTTYSDVNLTNDFTYYYRLAAVDSSGNRSSQSSQIAVTPVDQTPPAAPTGLVGTAGEKKATLNWTANAASDLSYYTVYRSLVNGFTATSGDSISRVVRPTTTYSDVNLTNDLTYYYRLAAVDSSGNRSGQSAQTAVTPVDQTPPAAPTGLNATPGDGNITLNWNTNAEADLSYYIVQRKKTLAGLLANPDSVARVNTPTASYKDTGVTNDSTYFYRIVAVDQRGNKSGGSLPESATPSVAADTTPPAAPTGLTASSGDKQVLVKWTRNTDNDLNGYLLYRSAISGFTPTIGDSIATLSHTATGYTNTGLTNGTIYYYRLVAFDVAGNRSATSGEASAIPDLSPTLLAVLPPFGPVTGGSPALIAGTNFRTGATVTIGGAAADSVKVVSSESITLRVPPGTQGRRTVTVTNPSKLSASLTGGFLYVKVDSVKVVVTTTATVNGVARTDTAHTGVVPAGLPYIVPPALTAPVTPLQPLFNALTGLSLEIPPGAVTENMTIRLDIQKVTVRNDSTIFARVNGKPTFFYVHPSVILNGTESPNFTFSSLAALHLTLRLNAFGRIMQASGVDTTAADTLAFAYATASGFTQEGMISRNRFDDRLMIASLTNLADLAGIRRRDLNTNTAAPVIVGGPFATPADTFAVITWRTDKLSTGKVDYGIAPNALTVSVKDTTFVIDHLLVLPGLSKDTKYYYRVSSSDGDAQTTMSETRSTTTVTRPDNIPPYLIVAPQVLAVSRHGAIVGWTTDEKSTSAVEYGPTTALGQFKSSDALVYRSVVALTGLTQNTTHYAVISSTDQSSNVTVFPDTLTFKTLTASDTTPPHLVQRPVVRGLTPNSAIIQWRTSEPSNSRVFYRTAGTTDTLQATNTSEILSFDHNVTLTGLIADTVYPFVVRSTDADGNTGSSRVDAFRTPSTQDSRPPVFIRGPEILYSSDRVVAIGWVTDELTDGFVYYKGGEDSTFIPRGSGRQGQRHLVIIGGLDPGTQYTFAVTATDPSGNTSVFPQGTVVSKLVQLAARATGVVAPQAFTIVTATSGLTTTTNATSDDAAPVITDGPTVLSVSSTSLTLAWHTDEPSDSRVRYGTDLSLSASDENIGTSHQITLTNLNAGTTYDYQVGSADPSGNGPVWSATGTATTSKTADTDAPVIVSGSLRSAVSNDRITVAWETNEPGDSKVEFGSSPTALSSLIAESDLVTAHSITLTNLSASQTYYLRALSTDLAGNGPTATSTLAVTTSATADTARPVIANLQRTTLADTDTTAAVTVSWTTDRLASRRLEYGVTRSLGSAVTDDGTDVSHSLSASRLVLNTKIYFRVGSASANDPQAERLAYSPIDSLITPATADTTAPAVPTGLTSVPGNGAVRVRWTASTSSNVTGYSVIRNNVTIATVGTEVTFLDESATNGQVHTYKLQAISALSNTSAASGTTSATPNTNKVPTDPTVNSPTPGDTVSLKPILVVGNATPVAGTPTRATLTYAFQVAKDAAFTTLIASGSGIVSGTSGNPTHWQIKDDSTGVSFLENGVKYWWRSRASDGEFSGAWSASGTFVANQGKPTGVTLATFSVSDSRGVVTLDWSVANGYESEGFHVLRSFRSDSGSERITKQAIPAGENGYTYVDRKVTHNAFYFYWLESASTGERFGPISVRVEPPRDFSLAQNVPNPFNPTTTIRFELPKAADVTLKVFNLLGQEVRTLINGRQEAGFHTVVWDGRNTSGRAVASGVYFYHLQAGTFSKAKKMLLLK